jgi:hypothetical protein
MGSEMTTYACKTASKESIPKDIHSMVVFGQIVCIRAPFPETYFWTFTTSKDFLTVLFSGRSWSYSSGCYCL